MWGAGHLAWGYLVGKTSSRVLRVEAKASLLLLAALSPDLDEILPINHRGPTHSLIIPTVAVILAFIIWHSKVIPYYIAFIQHGLIDSLTSIGVQFFWPLSTRYYILAPQTITRTGDIYLEWIGFFLSIGLMIKTRDFRNLSKPDTFNLLAVIPLVALAPAAFLARNRPIELLIPTAAYVVILALPVLTNILILIRATSKENAKPSS